MPQHAAAHSVMLCAACTPGLPAFKDWLRAHHVGPHAPADLAHNSTYEGHTTASEAQLAAAVDVARPAQPHTLPMAAGLLQPSVCQAARDALGLTLQVHAPGASTSVQVSGAGSALQGGSIREAPHTAAAGQRRAGAAHHHCAQQCSGRTGACYTCGGHDGATSK